MKILSILKCLKSARSQSPALIIYIIRLYQTQTHCFILFPSSACLSHVVLQQSIIVLVVLCQLTSWHEANLLGQAWTSIADFTDLCTLQHVDAYSPWFRKPEIKSSICLCLSYRVMVFQYCFSNLSFQVSHLILPPASQVPSLLCDRSDPPAPEFRSIDCILQGAWMVTIGITNFANTTEYTMWRIKRSGNPEFTMFKSRIHSAVQSKRFTPAPVQIHWFIVYFVPLYCFSSWALWRSCIVRDFVSPQSATRPNQLICKRLGTQFFAAKT